MSVQSGLQPAQSRTDVTIVATGKVDTFQAACGNYLLFGEFHEKDIAALHRRSRSLGAYTPHYSSPSFLPTHSIVHSVTMVDRTEATRIATAGSPLFS